MISLGRNETLRQMAQVALTDPARYQRYCDKDENMPACVVGEWARAGMQTVEMPHTYEAALLSTDIGELASDVRMPWPAFCIRVKNVPLVDRVIASEWDGAIAILIMWQPSNESLFLAKNMEHLAQATEARALEESNEIDTADKRALRLVQRLVVNTCLDIQAHHADRASVPRWAAKKTKPVWVEQAFAIGRPLKLDCRQEIADYLSGTRRSEPKVTTMVRGHWRNQAHGPERSMRRIQWIQPFYRGDGPLLVRPTLLGPVNVDADGRECA